MQVDLSGLDGFVALVQRASDDPRAVTSSAGLDRMRARPLLSREERRVLEELDEKGGRDDDMTTLVTKVRDGKVTWEAVLSGKSEHGALLQPMLAPASWPSTSSSSPRPERRTSSTRRRAATSDVDGERDCAPGLVRESLRADH